MIFFAFDASIEVLCLPSNSRAGRCDFFAVSTQAISVHRRAPDGVFERCGHAAVRSHLPPETEVASLFRIPVRKAPVVRQADIRALRLHPRCHIELVANNRHLHVGLAHGNGQRLSCFGKQSAADLVTGDMDGNACQKGVANERIATRPALDEGPACDRPSWQPR